MFSPPRVFTFDKLGETFTRAAIVQRQACLTLLLYAEAGRLNFWEGEAEVLMQVIQLIDEVTDISPQHLKEMVRCCNVRVLGGGHHYVSTHVQDAACAELWRTNETFPK